MCASKVGFVSVGAVLPKQREGHVIVWMADVRFLPHGLLKLLDCFVVNLFEPGLLVDVHLAGELRFPYSTNN